MSSLPPFLRGRRARVLLGSIVGLVVAGVVIGLLIALVSTKVLQAAGLDTGTTTPNSNQPGRSPSEGPTSATSTPATRPPSSATTREPKQPTLAASPTQVATYDKVTLSGAFPGLASGTALQLERRVGTGPWELFPVSLSSDAGGTFSTFVQTGRSGENHFRVSVPSSELTSPVVTVRVG